MIKSRHLDYNFIKKHARELRREMTVSEKLLWTELRNRKLTGHKFLRQHPIVYNANYSGFNYFIADFYCSSKKTVIELDGPIHESRAEYDEFRDMEMEKLGIHVLRLKNEELKNIKDALQKIASYLNSVT